ncbi:MAG TPA: MFS transporter, partial [Spirochaetia bacterium]|nr:MFS transporter [Spirochaetia bacterium]
MPSAPRSALPVLLIIASGYIAVNLNVQGLVAMLPLLQGEFGISRTQAGLYSSLYFASATVLAVFSGRMIDRIGPRVGLMVGCAAVGIMMVLHAVAPGFGLILGLASITGIGFSLITPSVNGGVIENVSPGNRAGSMGIAHGVGGAGALVGTMILPVLGERFGWRPIILFAGVFAIATALFIALVYGRFETDLAPSPTRRAEPQSDSFVHELRGLIEHRAFRCACVMGISFGLSVGSVTGHLALFVYQDLGFSPAIAGIALGLFHVGGILGQPTWGVVNDRLYRRRRHAGLLTLAVLTAVVSLVFGLVVARGTVSLPVILLLSALLGFFILGSPSLYFTAV